VAIYLSSYEAKSNKIKNRRSKLDKLASCFDVLKKRFPGYEDRPEQLEMADNVTGVGKSFGYLIPAIMSCKKTIVSTASLALQDQLAEKDLVFLQKELPQKFSFDILKGKNNYVCIKREREFSEVSQTYLKFRAWLLETAVIPKTVMEGSAPSIVIVFTTVITDTYTIRISWLSTITSLPMTCSQTLISCHFMIN
jgi:hypothetical protein